MLCMKIMYDGKSFGKAIKTKRIIDDDIDLREAAKKTGISAATLSRIERGRIPDLSTYATLCKWIGCTMEEYFIQKKKSK